MPLDNLRFNLYFNFMKLLLAFALFMSVSTVAADSMVISKPTRSGSGCNLAVAGFKSKNQFLQFFAQLQAAVKKGDKVKLSDMAIYPLNLNFGTKRYGQMKRKIKDKKDFINQFQSFYSKRVQSAVLHQRVDQLFCNQQGVMLGRGEVWIAPRGRAVGIITINN